MRPVYELGSLGARGDTACALCSLEKLYFSESNALLFRLFVVVVVFASFLCHFSSFDSVYFSLLSVDVVR